MSPHCNSNVFCSFLLSLTITAYIVIAIDSPSPSSSCPPDQRDALLQLKNSFFITQPPPIDSYDVCVNISYPKTASWRVDRDCCSWEGVACDNSTGNIVGLDLSCASLRGAVDSNSSLFSLRHLQSLNLFGNDLLGSTIPLEIRVFSRMMHLNISSSNVAGNVPTEISQLSKLVSLDLSGYGLEMKNPTMRLFIRNLTQLEELDLSSVDMYMVDPTSMMNFSSSLISLSLSDCGLGGRFLDYIFQLPNLRKLDLSYNTHLHGTLPESNWSSSLAFLSLWHCSFAGGVPHSIGSLPRLTHLDLSWNNFTGNVDFQTFSTLKNLGFLGLSGLSVSGEDATELSFPQLLQLAMVSCNLTKFPSFLSGSNKLRQLYLSGNMIEEIPSWFWGIGIDTLEELDLGDNLVRGGLRLPWKRLANLYLQNNLFNGSIPPSICQVTHLQDLILSQNNLTGVLPPCLSNLTDLLQLDLSSNSLTGPLPIPLAPSIHEFVALQNHFSGSIPPLICQLTHLQHLELGHNNLMGIIPQCLGNLTDLGHLNLTSNSLTGPLPPSLVNCTSMETLEVSFNFLGRWPGEIFLRSTSLKFIDLSSNKFEGPLPLPSYATDYYMPIDNGYYYSVSNNNFSGEINSLICNATNLGFLDLSNNGLTGTLPHCLTNITIRLNFLNLRANGFQGSIPEIFHEQSCLMSLDFSRNQFEGSLPRSLSNCKSLEVLDVGSNKIVDSFPDWLGDLPLQVLSLRSNKFRGHLSVSQGTRLFSKLRILDLSDNGFKGNLSDNLISEMFGMARGDGGNATGYMTFHGRSEYYSAMIDLKGVETEMVKIYINFATLDLSSNHFCGEIPWNIGLLKSLKSLNFSYNSFMGTIPPSLGNLTNLESLDLSSNHLVGEIPKELVKLTSLGALDLSWNNLAGPIPLGGHFNTFTDSFEGNPRLCGIPLTRVCGQGRAEAQPLPDQNDSGKDELGGSFEWMFVAMGFGCGVGIGISLGCMALEIGRPLWLARMVIQLEGSGRKRSKRKAPRRNSWA